MDKLELVKLLVLMKNAADDLDNKSFSPELRALVDGISDECGIDLEKTTPKSLFNKPYKDLTHDELREYSQIKRIIRRKVEK